MKIHRVDWYPFNGNDAMQSLRRRSNGGEEGYQDIHVNWCSSSAEVRREMEPHDTLVRLVHAFYPIFKLDVSRTQDEGLWQCLEEGRAAPRLRCRRQPGRRPREPSPGSEPAPWEWVLSE